MLGFWLYRAGEWESVSNPLSGGGYGSDPREIAQRSIRHLGIEPTMTFGEVGASGVEIYAADEGRGMPLDVVSDLEKRQYSAGDRPLGEFAVVVWLGERNDLVYAPDLPSLVRLMGELRFVSSLPS